ncbi:2061_t:CDS:2, partial [Gigaspora rosea]
MPENVEEKLPMEKQFEIFQRIIAGKNNHAVEVKVKMDDIEKDKYEYFHEIKVEINEQKVFEKNLNCAE